MEISHCRFVTVLVIWRQLKLDEFRTWADRSTTSLTKRLSRGQP